MRRRVAAGCLVVLFIGGCTGDGDGSPGAKPPPAASVRGATEWVAVVAVDDPDGLEDETAQLMKTAPDHFAVSPVTCWEGLAGRLGAGSDAYVAAVVAPSEQELDRAAAGVDGKVLFRGELPARCGD